MRYCWKNGWSNMLRSSNIVWCNRCKHASRISARCAGPVPLESVLFKKVLKSNGMPVTAHRRRLQVGWNEHNQTQVAARSRFLKPPLTCTARLVQMATNNRNGKRGHGAVQERDGASLSELCIRVSKSWPLWLMFSKTLFRRVLPAHAAYSHFSGKAKFSEFIFHLEWSTCLQVDGGHGFHFR